MKHLLLRCTTVACLTLAYLTSSPSLACTTGSCLTANSPQRLVAQSDDGTALIDYVLSTSRHQQAVGLFRQSLLDQGYQSGSTRIFDVASTLLGFDPPTDTEIPGLGLVDANLRSAKVEETFTKRHPDRAFDTITVTTELSFKYDFDTSAFRIHIEKFSVEQKIRLPLGSISASGG